jgi:tRNA nucleotidyltransferase (CCA-adding enzyme)
VLPGLVEVDLARLDACADAALPLEARWACLAAGAEALEALCDRLRVPVACRELAQAWQRERGRGAGGTPAEALDLFERCDAFRRPARFATLLALMALHDAARATWLQQAFERAAAVDAAAAARAALAAGATGTAVGEAIRQARLQALAMPDPQRGAAV